MAKSGKGGIQDQITDLITKVNEKNPSIVIFVAVGMILAVYYVVFLQGKLKELTELSTTISNSQQALDVTKNDIQRYPQYQDEVKNLQGKITALSRKIKSKEEIPGALQNLSQLASKNGVKIEQLMPDTDRGKVLLKNKEGKYVAIPVIIGAKSSYHNFGRFINALEQQGIFSSVADFGLVTNPEDSNQHLLKLVLHIAIFEVADKDEKPAGKK